MQIRTENNGKLYFVYRDNLEAESAYHRLKHLKPHICSHGGYLNAVVVDMRYVEPKGEA